MGKVGVLAALVAVLACSACGRVGFDLVGDSGKGVGDGALADGAPIATSCTNLASTCGPTGSSPCCESPVVMGGTFFRSYDVAADLAYTDMTRPATVSSFRLDKYEITVGRFRQFVAAGVGTQTSPPAVGAGGRTLNGTANQGGWEASYTASLAADTTALVGDIKCDPTYETWTDAPGANESRPMNCITWQEAMAFCSWDGGFLPTEAEWNYAASGGILQRAYPWSSPPGSTTIDCTTANYGGSNWPSTACVGAGANHVGSLSPAGDAVSGQSDLSGNVWEWLLDWSASPYLTPCNDCANLLPATSRVLRGGGFADGAFRLRASDRNVASPPTSRSRIGGVRCARSAS